MKLTINHPRGFPFILLLHRVSLRIYFFHVLVHVENLGLRRVGRAGLTLCFLSICGFLANEAVFDRLSQGLLTVLQGSRGEFQTLHLFPRRANFWMKILGVSNLGRLGGTKN